MLSRRNFLATAASATAAAASAIPAAAQSARPPNVVFILADDLGYADVGCYGQKDILTPSVDSLARDGMRFTQAYAGSTVCAPSRCCLMTGRHTGHATVRGNLNPHVPLTPEETTVAQIFQRAGYKTGAFGKWGLGTMPDLHALPTRKGFDEFYGYLDQNHAHTYYPDTLWDNEREIFLTENFGGGRKLYSHDLITERALKFIDKNHASPFFLYAPFTPPHGKFEAPDDKPYSDKPWAPVHKTIAAMITRLDRSVGMMLDRLKQYNIERDTLVIFTSDNGPGGQATKQFHSNGPLRGIKRDLYEGGIRVPFVARWPGQIQPGTSEEMVAFWDMLPTAAELVHRPAPKHLDGVSILPALRGGKVAANETRHLYWEFFERGFTQAVRWREWKAVRNKDGGKVGAPIELYNLANDLGERTDLAAKEPKMAAHMMKLMDTSRTPSSIWPNAAGAATEG
ncbi:MAG: arylsulfatase [Acidobacteriota bacterium]